MTFDEFYDKCDKMSKDEAHEAIKSLSDFGDGDRIADVAGVIDETNASVLVNRAINAGVSFSANDICIVLTRLSGDYADLILDYAIRNKIGFTTNDLDFISESLERSKFKEFKRKAKIIRGDKPKPDLKKFTESEYYDDYEDYDDTVTDDDDSSGLSEKEIKARNNIFIRNVIGKEMYEHDILGTRKLGGDSLINNMFRSEIAFGIADSVSGRNKKKKKK